MSRACDKTKTCLLCAVFVSLLTGVCASVLSLLCVQINAAVLKRRTNNAERINFAHLCTAVLSVISVALQFLGVIRLLYQQMPTLNLGPLKKTKQNTFFHSLKWNDAFNHRHIDSRKGLSYTHARDVMGVNYQLIQSCYRVPPPKLFLIGK